MIVWVGNVSNGLSDIVVRIVGYGNVNEEMVVSFWEIDVVVNSLGFSEVVSIGGGVVGLSIGFVVRIVGKGKV